MLESPIFTFCMREADGAHEQAEPVFLGSEPGPGLSDSLCLRPVLSLGEEEFAEDELRFGLDVSAGRKLLKSAD
jgi:hypothetical protein